MGFLTYFGRLFTQPLKYGIVFCTMDRKKYPRSYHLPSSPGATSDDKIASAETMANLVGKHVVNYIWAKDPDASRAGKASAATGP
jgi:hypothetical protein